VTGSRIAASLLVSWDVINKAEKCDGRAADFSKYDYEPRETSNIQKNTCLMAPRDPIAAPILPPIKPPK
jgi:hypothetical protein